jgi:hypothetical protein
MKEHVILDDRYPLRCGKVSSIGPRFSCCLAPNLFQNFFPYKRQTNSYCSCISSSYDVCARNSRSSFDPFEVVASEAGGLSMVYFPRSTGRGSPSFFVRPPSRLPTTVIVGRVVVSFPCWPWC